jgi:hypothetical protein
MFFAFFACQMKSEIIIFVARMSKTIPGIPEQLVDVAYANPPTEPFL